MIHLPLQINLVLQYPNSISSKNIITNDTYSKYIFFKIDDTLKYELQPLIYSKEIEFVSSKIFILQNNLFEILYLVNLQLIIDLKGVVILTRSVNK